MERLFHSTAAACSRLVTRAYSTSFSRGIAMLHRRFHAPIYAIYGFVRYADEIVDTFHAHDKATLLAEFRLETQRAIERGISLNPILHSFQQAVRAYGIEQELIDAFLHSMEMDLAPHDYDNRLYSEYIYGSAEVVGLMCLRVFCEGDTAQYGRLRPAARSLGAAFQKVNFLRDVQADFEERGRVYFPGVDFRAFSAEAKAAIEADIAQDFADAYAGIRALPRGARLGVYVAYIYYKRLFERIRRVPPQRILQERIRVPNGEKLALLAGSYFRHRLNSL